MDQSTRDRICSRSRTDGQVAVEINWTGPVTLICLVSQSCQFGQARSDQISADAACWAFLLAITVTAHYHPLLLPRSRQPDTGNRPWYIIRSRRQLGLLVERRGCHSPGTTVQRSRYNQSLASDRYQAAQIEQNTQAGRCWCQMVVVQIWPCACRLN